MKNVLNLFSRIVEKLSQLGCSLAGYLMMITAAFSVYEIIMRSLFNKPTSWAIEITTYILIWFGFISMAYIQREERHIRVDLVINQFSPKTRIIWEIITLSMVLIFVILLSCYGFIFFEEAFIRHETSFTILRTPMWIPKLAIPVGSVLLGLQIIKDIIDKFHLLSITPLQQSPGTLRNPFFLASVFFILIGLSIALIPRIPLAGLVLLMILLLFSGVHIFAALGLTGACGFFLLFGGLPALHQIPLVSFGALNNFSLACLPLFILASQILERGGVGGELYDLCSKWVGHLPGGLGIATIISCTIFASISVSSVATAITIGLIALPALEARKYDKKMSYGLVAAGGTLGIMVPPSGSMVVYSAVTEESLGQLFLAGIIPGLLVAVLFAIYTVLYCIRTGHYERGKKYTWKERIGAFKTGIWGLLAPLILIVGIYTGMTTPLEAGAGMAVYAIIMCLVRRKVRPIELPKLMADSAVGAGMLLVIISGALVLGTVMTMLQIPQMALNFVTAAHLPNWAVIAALMILFFILGMFLEVVSIMMITLPIIYPLIVSLGFDGVWFAVLMTINMEAALLTPPVGLNLFVIQGIAKAPLADVLRGVLPFFVLLVIGLAVIALFPHLSTYLPTAIIR